MRRISFSSVLKTCFSEKCLFDLGRRIKRAEAVSLIAENARISWDTADDWLKHFTRVNRKTGQAMLSGHRVPGEKRNLFFDEDEVLAVTREQFKKGEDGKWIPLRLAVLELNRRGFGGKQSLLQAREYLRLAMLSKDSQKRVRWRKRLRRFASPTPGAGRTERVLHPGDFEKLIARRKRELAEKLKSLSHDVAQDALGFLKDEK